MGSEAGTTFGIQPIQLSMPSTPAPVSGTGGAGTAAGLALAPATGGASLLIGAGVDLITGTIASIMNWKAAKDQIEATKEANRQQLGLYYGQMEQQGKQFQTESELARQKLGSETDLANRTLTVNKELKERELKNNEETSKFNKFLQFSEFIRGQFNQNPAFRDRVTALTKARAV